VAEGEEPGSNLLRVPKVVHGVQADRWGPEVPFTTQTRGPYPPTGRNSPAAGCRAC
jgi:hypothetical protein